MDTLNKFRQIIQEVLKEYTKIPYAYGEIEIKPIFNRESDNYLLLTLGWNGDRRIHGCLVHIDIIGDKVWIQRDGTEDGIAYALVKAGIPKDCIVLGFHEPDVRQFTGYAVA